MENEGTAFIFHHMFCYIWSKIYSDPLSLITFLKAAQNKEAVSHWTDDLQAYVHVGGCSQWADDC